MNHGNQLDSSAILTHKFLNPNAHAGGTQRDEPVAVMIDGQDGAKTHIGDDGRRHEQQVDQQKPQEIPPTETWGTKPLLGQQRPSQLRPALNPVNNSNAEKHLAQG